MGVAGHFFARVGYNDVIVALIDPGQEFSEDQNSLVEPKQVHNCLSLFLYKCVTRISGKLYIRVQQNLSYRPPLLNDHFPIPMAFHIKGTASSLHFEKFCQSTTSLNGPNEFAHGSSRFKEVLLYMTIHNTCLVNADILSKEVEGLSIISVCSEPVTGQGI